MLASLALVAAASVARLDGWTCHAYGARDNDHFGAVVCSRLRETVRVVVPGERVVVGETSVLGSPMVVVVGRYYSGDDAFYATTLLGIVDGQLRDLHPQHWITSAADLMCVGEVEGGKGVFGLTYDWDMSRESHGQPHRYRLNQYRWTGEGFEGLPSAYTQGSYRAWQPALAELKRQCPTPFGGLTGFEWPQEK